MGELLLHPALPLAVGAVLAWWLPRQSARVVLIAAPLVSLALVAQLETGTELAGTYLGFDVLPVRVDRLAVAFAWVFAIAANIAGVYGWRTTKEREPTAALAYAAAAMGVVLAGDLLTLFFFWEIKAIASTFVVLLRRGGNSQRAGMRYLFVHLVAGKLLLAGAIAQQASAGSLAFEAMELSAATVPILLAFLIAAAVPPLHAWLPDAYPEAGVMGTVLLSAYTTKAAVYALARGFPGLEPLVWLGVAMALYGVVYAVLENDIRRLLGYHIISQVGYMVAAIGIGTEAAINGATAHAFAHILYKGLLLMGAGAVIYTTGRSKMSELGGIANRQRLLLALYMIGAVSISSVPLFSGYVSKELAVEAAYLDHRTLVVLLLKVASVGTFLHTGLKLPYGTWFGREGAGPRTNAGHRIQVGPVPVSMYVAMAISSVLNLAIGVYPDLLYDLLPYAVEYEPYTISHVLEKVQLLLFTALGSWILLGKLGAEPTVSIDTDWLYRRLPRLVAARGPALVPASAHRAAAATTSTLRTARTRVLAQLDQAPYGQPPAVPPTWGLGAVVLLVGGLLLLINLVSP